MSLWKLLTARWGSGAGETDEVRIDASTNTLQTIDYAHHEVHSGSAYNVKGFVDLANGNVIDARVTTPNTTEWEHIIPTFRTETEYQFFIYEVVVIDTVGTAATPRNRNRNFNSGDPDQSSVAVDIIQNTSIANADADTDITGATLIYTGITGSAGKVGGGDNATDETVLKQNTIYCFRLHCISAGWVDFSINWYEHTDKH